MPQLLFGGLIAIILLGFYIWSIVDAIEIARCMERAKDAVEAGAQPVKCDVFTDNMKLFLNSIGGLISATVVGVLGATKAYEFPGRKVLGRNLEGTVQTIAGYMPSVYILFWMVCGVVTVIFGLGLYERDYVPPLSEHAKAWLGVAIAAGFAYFGINPEGGARERPAIARITIEPAAVTLTAGAATHSLMAKAADAQGNSIPNLPSTRFQWISDNPAVASVDDKGLVSRAGAGECNITATANVGAVVSNKCVVKCT